MSIKAIGWAFDQGPLSPTNKLVLIGLADNANDEGTCWPGWEHISQKTGLSRSSIYRAYGALEKEGLLTQEKDSKGREIKRLSMGPPVPQGNAESQSGTGSNKGTVKEPSQKQVSADVKSVYDHHLAVFKPARPPKLGPSLLRQIEKALKEYDAAALCVAIDGLFEWRKRKPGKETLGAIFDTYPGGKPLTEQIAFFISQAKGSTAVGRKFPSADRAIVAENQRLVQRGHRLSDNEEAVQAAKGAEQWLREHGIETVVRPEGVPTFAPITDKDAGEGV
jgi:biotin operon repressor